MNPVDALGILLMSMGAACLVAYFCIEKHKRHYVRGSFWWGLAMTFYPPLVWFIVWWCK